MSNITIVDNGCPTSPLFTADDISIQQVAMDTLGKVEEWVAVVNLNTDDHNGYFQSELPHCQVQEYLIGANVQVKAYIDNASCCDGWKDYKKCKAKNDCKVHMPTRLRDIEEKKYSRDVVLTGTYSKVTNSHLSERRRRLLKQRGGHLC